MQDASTQTSPPPREERFVLEHTYSLLYNKSKESVRKPKFIIFAIKLTSWDVKDKTKELFHINYYPNFLLE